MDSKNYETQPKYNQSPDISMAIPLDTMGNITINIECNNSELDNVSAILYELVSGKLYQALSIWINNYCQKTEQQNISDTIFTKWVSMTEQSRPIVSPLEVFARYESPGIK